MQAPSSEMLCLRDSHLLLRNVDDHKAVRRKNWGFWNVVLSTYAENIMESPENQLWSASANGNFSRLAEKHQNPTAQVSGTCNTKAETWALSTLIDAKRSKRRQRKVYLQQFRASPIGVLRIANNRKAWKEFSKVAINLWNRQDTWRRRSTLKAAIIWEPKLQEPRDNIILGELI